MTDRARKPKPTQAEIAAEIDKALRIEGLAICRPLALDRIKWDRKRAASKLLKEKEKPVDLHDLIMAAFRRHGVENVYVKTEGDNLVLGWDDNNEARTLILVPGLTGDEIENEIDSAFESKKIDWDALVENSLRSQGERQIKRLGQWKPKGRAS